MGIVRYSWCGSGVLAADLLGESCHGYCLRGGEPFCGFEDGVDAFCCERWCGHAKSVAWGCLRDGRERRGCLGEEK